MQDKIIDRIYSLCEEMKHDEAIELAKQISRHDFSVRAHLLVIEHERRSIIDGKKAK